MMENFGLSEHVHLIFIHIQTSDQFNPKLCQQQKCRNCLTDKQTCLLFTNAKTSGSLASEMLDMQCGAAVAILRESNETGVI